MRSTLTLAVLAALIVVGCASKPPPPRGRQGFGGAPPGPGAPGGRVGRGANLFISPSGEPFRGQPGEPYPVAAWFAIADANHDGKLTKKEFVADAMRFFAVLDVNKNGLLDGAEISRYEQVIAPEVLGRGQQVSWLEGGLIKVQMGGGGMGGGMGGGGGGGGGHGGGGRRGGGGSAPPSSAPSPRGQSMEGAAPYGLLHEPEPVAASDLSLSGGVTAADFERRAGQRFATLDTAGAGYLELATLPKTAVQAAMGAPGGRRRSA